MLGRYRRDLPAESTRQINVDFYLIELAVKFYTRRYDPIPSRKRPRRIGLGSPDILCLGSLLHLRLLLRLDHGV